MNCATLILFYLNLSLSKNYNYMIHRLSVTLSVEVSDMVHTEDESPQSWLGDVQTCEMTLASAYVKYRADNQRYQS